MFDQDYRRFTTVPFPPAGPEAVLRFTLADGAAASATVAPHGYGESWIEKIEDRVVNLDVTIISTLLKLALKQKDGVTPYSLDWNDPPFSLTTAKEPLLDALFRAAFNEGYHQMRERAIANRLAALVSTAPATPAAQADEAA